MASDLNLTLGATFLRCEYEMGEHKGEGTRVHLIKLSVWVSTQYMSGLGGVDAVGDPHTQSRHVHKLCKLPTHAPIHDIAARQRIPQLRLQH
jgi:hypothetical protein